MKDTTGLDGLISEFVNYVPPEVTNFRQAIKSFREDIPKILIELRDLIEKQTETNKQFSDSKDKFLAICRQSINPEVSFLDVREMIIQHILTEDIFISIFNETQFHRENNIARELHLVVNTFFTGNVKRNTFSKINSYYEVIKRTAANIANHHEKQKFLKAIYEDEAITKLEIFHYTYAVLHNPAYREKYELNLKREFPRIPFYDNFRQWADWGRQLMDLHINYETIEPYALKRIDIPSVSKTSPKVKLKADRDKGIITLDADTSLHNVPCEAWEYKLGNRSALEWILDQYKEKKPKDKTIAEKFNTYRFADYKEQVIDLLQRVCTVSVETMKIIKQMK